MTHFGNLIPKRLFNETIFTFIRVKWGSFQLATSENELQALLYISKVEFVAFCVTLFFLEVIENLNLL